MKKSIFLSISLMVLLSICLSSCHDKSKVKTGEFVDRHLDTTMVRTPADTLSLLTMCTDYLNLLQKDSVEAALDMLYTYEDGEVQPINDEVRNKLRTNHQRFPVVKYKLESMHLYGEDDSEFVYMIEFFEKPEGDPRPNSIREALSPVRVNGQWYLTVAEEINEDRKFKQ